METTELTNRVSIKLFAGFPLTSELKMHLNQSHLYKQSKIGSNGEMIEVHASEREYFGVYLTASQTTIPSLKILEGVLILKLNEYCPKYPTEKLSLTIIPQVFVT